MTLPQRIVALVLALAVTASATPVSAVPASSEATDDDPQVHAGITLLDAWIRTRMEYEELPGLVIGITHDQNRGGIVK